MSNRQGKAIRRLAGLVEKAPGGTKQLSDYTLEKLKYSGFSTPKASNRAALTISVRKRTPRSK